MDVLLPAPEPARSGAPIDPYDCYRPPVARWLRINMVVSLDGAVNDERGRSGGLGGAGDRAVFFVLRALADAIVVGAGTARVERYGPHRPSGELRRRRVAEGRSGAAPLVVVTGSARLDYDSPLFTQAEQPTVVLTCAATPEERRAAAAAAGRLLVAGTDSVDLAEGLRALREDLGLHSLLCEGGPHLNGALLATGLVDELCTTLAPRLVPGPTPRFAEGLSGRHELLLTGVMEHEGELFLRHRLAAA